MLLGRKGDSESDQDINSIHMHSEGIPKDESVNLGIAKATVSND